MFLRESGEGGGEEGERERGGETERERDQWDVQYSKHQYTLWVWFGRSLSVRTHSYSKVLSESLPFSLILYHFPALYLHTLTPPLLLLCSVLFQLSDDRGHAVGTNRRPGDSGRLTRCLVIALALTSHVMCLLCALSPFSCILSAYLSRLVSYWCPLHVRSRH